MRYKPGVRWTEVAGFMLGGLVFGRVRGSGEGECARFQIPAMAHERSDEMRRIGHDVAGI